MKLGEYIVDGKLLTELSETYKEMAESAFELNNEKAALYYTGKADGILALKKILEDELNNKKGA